MDDSDQDFSFLCSRLLKRVRRKGGESGDEKKIVVKDEGEDGDSGSRIQSRSKAPCKRKREKKGGLQSKMTDRIRAEGPGNGGSEAAVVGGGEQKEQKIRAKEKVLSRMQRFKRATPPRLVHTEEQASAESAAEPAENPSLPAQGPTEKQESDNVLAQRLQQQLDREAESQAVVDVEDRGLFFCQLCYKDLSAMSHQLRTQHINRCLDEHESSTSRIPAPPRPRIPECPICGKGFKSEKTRSTHLKRCSASMGVSPAELLKALHRQAAERENGQQAGGSSDTSDSSVPVRKRPRKKAPRMDEDTMMALALSRSLLEQEKERERDREEERRIQAQLASATSGAAPVVQGRAGAGKSRVKRRKGDPAAPPPLLLVQDPQAAQNRIQERVSSLLLLPRPPTPPTPTLIPSALSTHTLLWLKSALPGGGPTSLSDFYSAELRAFIQPEIGAEENKSPPSEATPVKQRPATASASTTAPEHLLDASAAHRPSTPSLGTPGTQALTDLVDLAEEGMTLTQYKSTDTEPSLSGFVPEPSETQRPPINSTSVSRLCSDLGSMVNNPQLSDVQLQVDSGDVYFAHSFMLYTRCPLLANMVHDAGFGVQEEGFPQAQRVLLNDVSGKAVYALLQFLYTAVCHLTHTLLPDVLQLASRFGLSELQQQCEQYLAEDPGEQEPDESAPEPQQSLVDTQFLELLRSMWEHEDGDGKEVGEATRGAQGEDEEGSGDGETKDDIVDEDELNEIYKFAATQRKRGAERELSTESGNEEEEADEGVNDNCSEAERRDEGKQNVEMEDVHRSAEVDLKPGSDRNVRRSRGPDTSLDRSYNHLFSESWGQYVEPSRTQIQHLDRKNTPMSRRTSSVNEVIDLSISPPPDSGEPARLQFPITGMSPGESPDQSEAVKQTSESLKGHCTSQLTSEPVSKSPSTSSLSKTQLEVTTSLPSSTKPKLSSPAPSRSQPELIVLSDSSDDMEPDLPDEAPALCHAPRPPTSSPSRLSLRYTQIKAKEATQVELSPKRSPKPSSSVRPETSRSDQVGSEDVLDGSAEVSWLIPATPEPSTRTSTTQTSSSMRRTRLFPRSQSSSSSSSSYSSTISDNPKTISCSNSLKEPHREHFQQFPAFQKLTSHSSLSKTSHSDPVNRTYPNSTSIPCSSTPLHSDPHLQRLDSLGSPLLRDSKLRTQRRASQEGRLGSLHPSPSENSLSPQRSSRSDKESSKSPASSQNSDNPGDQETSTEKKEPSVEEEFSFVFDEPPIAFNDSWGLGGAVAEQGPRFSLRLESSGDQTSPAEQSAQGETASMHAFSPPGQGAQGNLPDPGAPPDHSLPDAAMWDSWKEEEVEALPLSQRVGAVALAKRVSELRTPVACKKKMNQAPLVPITPMPSFSDMDTPELKNKLNRYGVRPLPKKQMVLKLKEIHQYTHQLMSSGSEEETSPRNRPRAAPAAFKQPTAPPPVSPRKLLFGQEEEEDALPASQESNTSSTAESERSNPEVCDSDDDGSDSEGITASQAAVREKDKLQAVRSFILSDPVLYGRVLQYQPLVLCELKAGLRTAGVRLGTAKLLDFLDSQCITFTTAKQGHPAPSRRRARGGGRGRKRLAKAVE
ncbi:hypothetical protein KOW79_021564 [Hemibagrus wyckioides]|uniref:Structure-specific endonuclease subunit SLX4 n=1 Tax=Hemibagrus wyckioides TaxID=337641 RepID=A0A9D3N2S0_9TELE|nr:structure-specific endonuclease subunit SLX4 [Hemibagrus wyckioides]KAG7315476.1 hypothetical protein KOW79_021564 [Hemibagrus wyckioides]